VSERKHIITTMPIKPYENNKYGIFITPLVNEIISEFLNIKSILAVNLLHSFDNNKKNYLNLFLNDAKLYGCSINNVLIDIDNKLSIENLLQSLYIDKKIISGLKEVVRCSCGAVYELSSNYDEIINYKLIYEESGLKKCKLCNTVINKKVDEVLYIKYLDLSNKYNYKLYPEYLRKDIEIINEKFKGRYQLVSKDRYTGVCLKINKKVYNIDVDFCLDMTYFSYYKEETIIITATYKQLVHYYKILQIADLVKNKNIFICSYPYLNTNYNIEQMVITLNNSFKKKLFLLFNLKFNQKDCELNKGIYKYLLKINDSKAEDMYNHIITKFVVKEKNNIDNSISNFYNSRIDLQKVVNELNNKF